MLTSFVGKNDPLVAPKPDPRLLKDAPGHAGRRRRRQGHGDRGRRARWRAFPRERAYYGDAKPGFDIQIDDELIQYRPIGGPDGAARSSSARADSPAPQRRPAQGRGQDRTTSPSATAATWSTCARRSRTSWPSAIAGVINRCGFDMIYFDGGECNTANGPVLVLGQPAADGRLTSACSATCWCRARGGTPWTWHIFARGCCDDFAAVAPKQYLDYHKIADSWTHYTQQLPAGRAGLVGLPGRCPAPSGHQPRRGGVLRRAHAGAGHARVAGDATWRP